MEPAVADGWKQHYAEMMSDKKFSTWFGAWWEHDHLLRARFMIDPFILNPDHLSYVHQFKRCRGDQTHLDLLAVAPPPKKDSGTFTGVSSRKSVLFQPYPKGPHRLDSGGPTCHGSFHPPLCVQCGRAGHRASMCNTTRFTTFNRPIVDWKSNHLVSKSGKHVCLIFNIRGTCTTNPLHGIHVHGAHLCSLCGDNRHAACNCSRN